MMDLYDVNPECAWLLRSLQGQTRVTGDELRRPGREYNVKNLLKIGVISLVETQSPPSTEPPVPAAQASNKGVKK
jgi:hypothetical protein